MYVIKNSMMKRLLNSGILENMKSCKDKELMFKKLSEINKAVYLITENLYENQYCIDSKSTIREFSY